MANTAPTIAWILTKPLQSKLEVHSLNWTPGDKNQKTDNCKIGLVDVVVAHATISPARTDTIVPALPPVQARVVTSCTTEPFPGAKPWDLLVFPPSRRNYGDPDAMAQAGFMNRAVDVFRTEAEESGFLPQTAGLDLVYLESSEAIKQLVELDIFHDEIPTLFVIGVENAVHSPATPFSCASEYAVLLSRDLIWLTGDPTVRDVPCLEGTEKVIPARPPPKIAQLPTHQFPSHGNTVLLVIPTENKEKKKLLQECIAEKTPAGLQVHTIAVPVESDVGNQPYNGAGAEGAYNRIRNVLYGLGSDRFKDIFLQNNIGTVMVASIENYIQIDGMDRPADFGIIVVHNATTGRTETACSRGVTISSEYVERAQRFGHKPDDIDFDEDTGNECINYGIVTVGRVLAARVPGLDRANWHEVVSGTSRYDLLREAMESLAIPW